MDAITIIFFCAHPKRRKGIPQGHDSGDERDAGDGVEIGEMREKEVNRAKDHDEVSCSNGFAVGADSVMELLQRFASSDHVNYVDTYFHH